MTFEEDFPSLKKIQLGVEDGVRVQTADKWNFAIPLKDIQEHCLDKQRVRDAIEKHSHRDEDDEPIIWKEDFMKELGL